MTWKEYNYTGEWNGTEIIFRPMIGLQIRNNKESVDCLALIDSGCDGVFLDAEFAKLLDIDEKKCQTVKASGFADKGITGFIAKINFKIEGYENPIEAEARFIPGMRVAALLGQKYFFDNFKILFEKKNRVFKLSLEK